MKIGVIIQARMSSKRFPGKVLHKLNGKTVFEYLFESLQRCKTVSDIVIATSLDPTDEPLVRFCADRGISVVQGSLENVAGRFAKVVRQHSFEGFVRLCADSPLLDYRLVDHAVNIYQQNSFDMVTNIMPRSYPRGQSVEVLRTNTFLSAYDKMHGKYDREHVTPFFYNNPKQYCLHNFSSPVDYSGIRTCIDTADDMKFCEEMISNMTGPHWKYSLSEIIVLHEKTSKTVQRVA